MNVFEYLEENKETVSTLVKLGFINPSVLGSVDVYRRFNELKHEFGTIYQCCEETALKVKLKPDTVKKIILKLEKPLPS